MYLFHFLLEQLILEQQNLELDNLMGMEGVLNVAENRRSRCCVLQQLNNLKIPVLFFICDNLLQWKINKHVGL